MVDYEKSNFGEPAEFVMRTCGRCEELQQRLAASETFRNDLLDRLASADDQIEKLQDTIRTYPDSHICPMCGGPCIGCECQRDSIKAWRERATAAEKELHKRDFTPCVHCCENVQLKSKLAAAEALVVPSVCGHQARFVDWENHGRPIVCSVCEMHRLTVRFDTAEAECLRLQADLGHGRDERAKLRERLAAAEDALQSLYDWQNGCPLPSYKAGWTAAMVAAENVLRDADKRLEEQIAAKEVRSD